jgi:hypothetical protein
MYKLWRDRVTARRPCGTVRRNRPLDERQVFMALTNLETWISDRIEWFTPRHVASLRRAVNADIKEAGRTVRSKRAVQQRKGEICSKIIESTKVCQYCQREYNGNCFPCNGFDAHSRFIGRKLSPIA